MPGCMPDYASVKGIKQRVQIISNWKEQEESNIELNSGLYNFTGSAKGKLKLKKFDVPLFHIHEKSFCCVLDQLVAFTCTSLHLPLKTQIREVVIVCKKKKFKKESMSYAA